MNSARQLVILLLATDYCAQKFVLESIRRAIKPFHMTKNVTGIIHISVSADFLVLSTAVLILALSSSAMLPKFGIVIK